MKNVPGVGVVERDVARALPELGDELHVAFCDVAGLAREGLLAMSVGVGLRVTAETIEAEDAELREPQARHCARVAEPSDPSAQGACLADAPVTVYCGHSTASTMGELGLEPRCLYRVQTGCVPARAAIAGDPSGPDCSVPVPSLTPFEGIVVPTPRHFSPRSGVRPTSVWTDSVVLPLDILRPLGAVPPAPVDSSARIRCPSCRYRRLGEIVVTIRVATGI